MASQTTKIQLEFHNSSLSEEESEKAELTGMLVLAADFIKSNKVNRADRLERISKMKLPLYLNKTKSGGYIALNPFSKDSMRIPLMRLPSLSDITEFCSEPTNLDLNKLYSKLNAFQVQEAKLQGGYNANQLKVIDLLLQAPRSTRTDFNMFPPLRDIDLVKEDLSKINQIIYDEKSLKDAIKQRLVIIDKALAEESLEYEQKLSERNDYWKHEIKNKNEILQREIKERDAELKKELKNLEKDTQRKIKDNTKTFLAGVSKNIRKDEKPIEKNIQELERLTADASADKVHEIEASLKRLSDVTETFRAAVGFAQSQVKKTKFKEEELVAIYNMDSKTLKERADRDKEALKEQSKMKEAERDKELKRLKEDRDAANKRLSKFRDVQSDWSRDIEAGIDTKGTAMLDPSSLRVNNPNPIVELHIPFYIFQYKKKNEHYTVAVPPVNMPDSMKKASKNSLYGDQRTVFYNPVVVASVKLLAEWFEKESQALDMNTAIQQLPNLLDNPAVLRDTFFNSQSLMVDKLKVNKKDIKKANDRLTEVFASG
ncbi:MAG: hypothetical protein ACXAD7_06710 [Candidatus Kariarchaeaceae archaeon]|jgi:hypothetical protein